MCTTDAGTLLSQRRKHYSNGKSYLEQFKSKTAKHLKGEITIFSDLSKGTLQNALLLNVIPTALIGLVWPACQLMLANVKSNENI